MCIISVLNVSCLFKLNNCNTIYIIWCFFTFFTAVNLFINLPFLSGLGKNPIIKIPVNTMTEAESNKPLKLRLDTNTSTNQLIAVQQNPTFNPPLPSTRQKQILKPGSQNISTIKPTTTQHTRPLPVSGSSAGNAQTVTATHVNTSGTIPSSSATRFMIMTADGQMVPISEHQLHGLVQSGADITNVDNTGNNVRIL